MQNSWYNEISFFLIPVFASSIYPEKYLANALDMTLMLSFIALMILLILKYVKRVELDYSKPWLIMYWCFWNPIFGMYLLIKNRNINDLYRFFSLALVFVTFYAFFLNEDNDYISPKIVLKADEITLSTGNYEQADITSKLVKKVSDNRSLLSPAQVEIKDFDQIDFEKASTSTQTLSLADDSENDTYVDFKLTIK